MPRKTKNILNDLCGYDTSLAKDMDRLPHDCYMILVGRLKSKKYLKMLKGMDPSQENASSSDEDEVLTENDENQIEYSTLATEQVESFLEHMALLGDTEQVEDERKSHLVYEDSFNSSLIDMVITGSSFEKLKEVCRKYEYREEINIDKVMAEHEDRVRKSQPYFSGKKLPLDEAKALAFALSFYTGTRSESLNRGASLIARKANGQVLGADVDNEINEAAIILYYLVKALSYIPFYWGWVTRACQLTFDELQIYKPGSLITWIQFSSSTKGKRIVDSDAFKGRNVLFKIYSLTGRPIKDFSNYPKEDEVLFLPHSTFLVFNHKVFYGQGNEGQGRHVFYMRQIELGLCQWSVLWVDDQIFDENWENKKHMEYAAVKALDVNVHFIPKSSTESALSFLRSTFGKRLMNQETFRIVTDMNRKNETPSHNAGARFIKAVRQMGFRNKCLVFTGDEIRAKQILQSELRSKEQEYVLVSEETSDLRSFVNFDQKPTHAQRTDAENSSKSKAFQTSTYPKPSDNSYKSTNTTAEVYHGASGGKYHQSYINKNTGIMHNHLNTDVDILVQNCKKKNMTNDRYKLCDIRRDLRCCLGLNKPMDCVLLTTGSFNPIHPLHFQNLVRVKKYFESEHQPRWNVLAGYLSPTHDSYVHGKLGELDWIPAKDRCRLCEGAIEHEGPELSSWLRVSRGESEWADGFVDFGPVTENLRDFLNNTLVDEEHVLRYPLCVVYVCGLDHFNKCSYVENMTKQPNMSCAVVYRTGYEEQRITRSIQSSDVIYIPLSKERGKLTDVSSTQIRQHFQNPSASKANIKANIYPIVDEYMRKKYRRK
ncbi:unnamed protein product [Rotaria socialis]|uniref:NAD(P)(+)--arginine ADP-ribosyltransferase n=1 Tax=Rotaria socialis TaxID=392032 RepID=A0A821A9D2_9BILA|nr:unnamed protein product [Rotaria socialis]